MKYLHDVDSKLGIEDSFTSDLCEGIIVHKVINNLRDKDMTEYELHRNYMDIHYIVNGEEGFGISTTDIDESYHYDEKADIAFVGTSLCDQHDTTLRTGEFCMVWPNEIHKPSLKTIEDRTQVTKVIIKVKL